MTDIRIWRRVLAMSAVLLLAVAGTVLAQAPTGNLYGTVTDPEGARLPGVTVTLTGIGAPRTQVTAEQGNFRFLGLDPGAYSIQAELEGFSTVEQAGIDIRVARSTEIQVQMSAAVEEVITVTSESPLLDERKLMTGTSISQIELEKIPTARDPWAILNQTPGVMVDRVNVGGNESGQQSIFLGQGVSDDENDFLVDGLQTTDMRAIGASSTYYDFDQFAEIQTATGGTDVTKNTAGVSVNLVTKRGTNDFRGSARFYVTDGGGQLDIFDQADPSIDASDLGAGQESFSGNQINRIEDFGIELGGPLVRDRVWLWGSWAENDIKNFVAGAGGTLLADDTILENTSMKLNAQLSGANSAVASWNNGDKQKFGRNASPTRPDETTWNQRGPSAIWKVEDTHVFSSSFFLTGTWSHLDFGFGLAAKAGVGDSASRAWRDADNVWHDGFLSGASASPEDQYKVDGSYFFNTGEATGHEIKFGGRYRDYETISTFAWPGGEIFSLALGGGTFPLVVTRRGVDGPPVGLEYTSLWVQDTISSGRFTYNVGLRYDLQEGSNLPLTKFDEFASINKDNVEGSGVRANPWVPDQQQALEFGGADAPFDWESIAPRVGVTYALGEERKTLLRASFSQFAEQLSAGDINRLNPAVYSYAYFLNLTDYNAYLDTGIADPNARFDPGDELGFLFPFNVDLARPFDTPNITDPNYDPELTSEVVLGVEHALLPEFVVGLNLTLRETDDIAENRDLVRPVGTASIGRLATVDDYVPDEMLTGTLPDGSPFAVQTFTLQPGLEFTGGSLRTNGDRTVEYQGIGLTLNKRLANRWMARGNFVWGEAEWDIGSEYLRFQDPNPNGGPGALTDLTGSDVDGGLVATVAAGSGAKADVVLQSTWSANLNGMYQIAPDRPWGFNVAANLYAREGYVLPYWFEFTGADGQTRDIRIVNEIDDFRVDDIFTTDLSISKDIRSGGDLGVTLSLDVFNVFNENYVLQRERNLDAGTFNFLRETLSPRIWRLGTRLSWK